MKAPLLGLVIVVGLHRRPARFLASIAPLAVAAMIPATAVAGNVTIIENAPDAGAARFPYTIYNGETAGAGFDLAHGESRLVDWGANEGGTVVAGEVPGWTSSFSCQTTAYGSPPPGTDHRTVWIHGDTSATCTVTHTREPTSDPPPTDPPPPACADGIDNDGDGLVDFPGDPGCIDPGDVDESNALIARCDDYFVKRGSRLRVQASDGILANDDGSPSARAVVTRTRFASKKLLLNTTTGGFSFDASAKTSKQGWFDYKLRTQDGRESGVVRVRLYIYDRKHPPARTPGGCSDSIEFSKSNSVDAASLAPLVWIHSDEDYFPMDPAQFIRRSSLKWAHGAGCPNHREVPNGQQSTVDPWRLGDRAYFTPLGPYRHARSDSSAGYRPDGRRCLRPGSHDDVFHTGSYDTPTYTAPWRAEADRGQLQLDEGWYLDYRDNGRPDKVTGPRVPRQWGAYGDATGARLSYWFFFPSSQGLRLGHRTQTFFHEGDWERVVIDTTESMRVTYFQHGEPKTLPYEKVEKHGKRPVVYIARHSHASYPSPGDGREDRNRGYRWETWKKLDNVRSRAWYGFGGAWGWVKEVGEFKKDSSGPSGPSRHKSS